MHGTVYGDDVKNYKSHRKRCHVWPTRGGHVAEQCHAADVIFVFACSWFKVARIDKFRGHFFAFASSWTKVAQGDKLKSRKCILLLLILLDLLELEG